MTSSNQTNQQTQKIVHTIIQLSRKEGLRVKFKRLTRQQQQQLNVSFHYNKKKHEYLGKKKQISHLKNTLAHFYSTISDFPQIRLTMHKKY